MPQSGKSRFVDVVFPRNINRLTYILPDELVDQCRAGTAVESPIRGRNTYGIVIGISLKPPRIGKNKKLSRVTRISPDFGFSASLLALCEWISEYYICSEGLALKSLLFTDILGLPGPKKPVPEIKIGPPNEPLPDMGVISRRIKEALFRTGFQPFLFHSKSMLSDISLVMDIVRNARNIIILVPERYDLSYFLPYLKSEADGRFCVLHGSMSKSAKADAYAGIFSGKYDIVIGTMQTVFAPMPNPSLIIVLKEHSEFYKHEETPMYNVRDVAVKRGSLENIPVLLTSLVPSFESYYNSLKGKYSLIEDTSTERPEIRIINAAGSGDIVTSPLKKRITAALGERKDVLLVLNRKGHSVLKCGDCDHIEICPNCDVPYVFHSEKILRCHYCNNTIPPYEVCPKCKGVSMKFIGAGTEKIYKILEKEFDAVVTLIDAEHPDSAFTQNDRGKIIIGTELALRRIKPFYRFGLTAVLNADISLHKPDFRVYEKLFQDFVYLSQLSDTHGDMYIQTFNWKNPFFAFVKRYDYKGFFKNEIPKRRDFRYPPFFKIALLSIKKSALKTDTIAINEKDIELLGPIVKGRGKKERIEFLLKYTANIPVQKHVRNITGSIARTKKDLKIDIDPLVFS